MDGRSLDVALRQPTYIGGCVRACRQREERVRESDVVERRGAAAVGLCKALPQPRSHSSSVEAQSVSEIHSLC